ncbi:MAG TPA: type II toxin-antitoxin system HicB family antitoxin [Thermoanaerobaculia bacterium]|nr:type II toxin-antitoxin system HicB family antitoxin [Thermoanaerobaculia bacterium]
MHLLLTAIYVESSTGKGVVAYVEELAGVVAQGETVEEARRKLRAAIDLEFAANRFRNHRLFATSRVVKRGSISVRMPGWERGS